MGQGKLCDLALLSAETETNDCEHIIDELSASVKAGHSVQL